MKLLNNKRGIAPLLILILIALGLLLFNMVGVAVFVTKLQKSPFLIILLIVGVFILFKMFKR